MFIAATAGIGFTAIWILFDYNKTIGNEKRLPAYYSWQNAFDLFELVAVAALGTLNIVTGAPGSGFIWLISLALLSLSTWFLSQTEKGVSIEKHVSKTTLAKVTSVFLVAMAFLFIAFPVLQPWSGPPEPFVRWHPFSPLGELVWRGIFLSFSFGMLLTATDPLGKHRTFLVALVFSGYLHSGEMAVDSLLSMQMNGMNANPEHLYGDVLGWFVIASVSLLFLLLSRKSEYRAMGTGR
jgi:hypothetical protein